MSNASNPGLAEVAQCVRRSLHQILEVKGKRPAIPVHDSTVLMGAPDALLDSLDLAMFFFELEQELQRRCGVSVDLFSGAGLLDEKDGAQTLRTITDRILDLLGGSGGAAAMATMRHLV